MAGPDLYYSDDGINWTQTNSLTGYWHCLTYGNGRYVAGIYGRYLYYSDDGINWTQTNSLTGNWESLTFG